MDYRVISGQANSFEHIWVDKNGRPMQQDYPDWVHGQQFDLTEEIEPNIRLVQNYMIKLHQAGIPYGIAQELIVQYHGMLMECDVRIISKSTRK